MCGENTLIIPDLFHSLAHCSTWGVMLLNNLDVINNVNIYAKLNPKSRFFLDKNGNEFNHKITNSNYQPYGLRRYTNNLNFGEGINIKGLRESFIANTWNASRDRNLADVQIIKDLSVLTGLSTNAIRPKIIRRDKGVLEVVKNMYENL